MTDMSRQNSVDNNDRNDGNSSMNNLEQLHKKDEEIHDFEEPKVIFNQTVTVYTNMMDMKIPIGNGKPIVSHQPISRQQLSLAQVYAYVYELKNYFT